MDAIALDFSNCKMQRTSTGRSTQSKESKERNYSNSTSKGLLTSEQREFSLTLRGGCGKTPRSYTVGNGQHPFRKNSSASKSTNVDHSPMTQQTFSSELLFGVVRKDAHCAHTPILEDPEDV